MKAAYGMVRQIKKQLTTDIAIIEIEINKRDYKAAVQLLDGQTVLVTIAQDIPGGYGVLEGDSKPDPAPRPFAELPPSQQAALRCKERKFQDWLGTENENECVFHLYDRLHIKSRRELDTPGKAQDLWVKLDNAFWAETRYEGMT